MDTARTYLIAILRAEIRDQGAVIQALPEGDPIRSAYLADIAMKAGQIRRLEARQALDRWLGAGTIAAFGAALIATQSTALVFAGALVIFLAASLLIAYNLSGR